MSKSECKGMNYNSLRNLNEVTLKYRLDLVRINSENKFKGIDIKDNEQHINKQNLFLRLNSCKGLNFDQDILAAKKKTMRLDMKSLLRRVDQTISEVEKNVNKFNDKYREKPKIIHQYNKEKVVKPPENPINNISDLTQLDKIRLIINNEENQINQQKPLKIINRVISPNSNKKETLKKLNKKRIISVNQRKDQKKIEIKLPMINHRILLANDISKINDSSLVNLNSSFGSNIEENDIDEIMINDDLLLIKKFVLPKISLENSINNINKSRVKVDKNKKLLLRELLKEEDLIDLIDPSKIIKRKGKEFVYSSITEKKIKRISRKASRRQKDKIEKIRSLVKKNSIEVLKNLKKEEWFSMNKDREKLRQLLNNNFGKLENISNSINATLDSALELLYKKAVESENNENIYSN